MASSMAVFHSAELVPILSSTYTVFIIRTDWMIPVFMYSVVISICGVDFDFMVAVSTLASQQFTPGLYCVAVMLMRFCAFVEVSLLFITVGYSLPTYRVQSLKYCTLTYRLYQPVPYMVSDLPRSLHWSGSSDLHASDVNLYMVQSSEETIRNHQKR